MQRRRSIVFLVLIITIVLTWLIIENGKQKVEKENDEVNPNEQIDVEEGKMKKNITKVQLFDPNQSLSKSIDNDLSFSLVETEDSTALTKRFTYTISNEGTSNKKLSFTTSQRYDYELSSKEHGFIERYSEGKNFLQVLEDIILSPQEELSYTISLPSLEKGNYSLTVYLTAHGINGPGKRLLFTVE